MSSISKEEFEKMRKAFEDHNLNKTKSVLIPVGDVAALVKNPAADGIRVYFGETDKGENTVMLICTDKDGNDLFDDIKNRGQLCPPYCP